MRALLKAAGIDAWVTAIYSGDRDYVQPEWASPEQFNHAIVAIRVSDSISLASVLRHPTLGRLLMFDPTDRITPVGGLPEHEQGSHALVIAGQMGALITMPVISAMDSRVESTADASVDLTGHVEAHIEREYFGQSSVPLRRVERLKSAEELKHSFERGIAQNVSGATLKKISTREKDGGSVAVSLDLAADRFAQNMQGNLLIVHPGLLASGGDYFFSSEKRTWPVELEADLRKDSIRIKLPDGFKVDELPEHENIESPYGKTEAQWTVKDNELAFTQALEIHQMIVPAAEYGNLRKFFEQLAGAREAPVILVKK